MQRLRFPIYRLYSYSKAGVTHRINGAKVFGLRLGSPCLYTIAATGDFPMMFAAKGMPKGLKLDAETGRIIGKLKKRGACHLMLKATNLFHAFK